MTKYAHTAPIRHFTGLLAINEGLLEAGSAWEVMMGKEGECSSYRLVELNATVRTESNSPPAKLIVNHPIAALAVGGEANIEPGDEDNRWPNEKYNLPLKTSQHRSTDEQEEYDAGRDRETAMNLDFLLSGLCTPD